MRRNDLREALKNKLSPNEILLVPRSFDIIGSRQKAIAIIELPDPLKPHEQIIAKALMQVHKNITSVLRKHSKRNGVYRLRNYELIFGDDDTEILHKEYNCYFKLDPQKVYFSSREGTDRLKIAAQVMPGEVILVMFSGIGPLPILIAKKQPNVKRIYAIELNPIAHHYCLENVRINKLAEKIVPIQGDVREVCPKLDLKFDRILMPLPKGAHEFLDVAIKCARNEGIIHFYHWASEWDLYSEAEESVLKIATKLGRTIDIQNKVRVLPFAPRKWKVRLDVRIH